MSLAERMKEARKIEVVYGGMKFIGSRPDAREFGKLYNANADSYEIACKLITNWENVRESNLLKDGSDDLVPFSQDVFKEFIVDAPNIAELIRDSVIESLNQYLSIKEELQKN